MNDTLDIGSVIPYIVRAKAEGYSVIVLNPNLNYVQKPKGRKLVHKPIRYNGDMFAHCEYVWRRFIQGCVAKQLYIVAHSAGGYCTGKLFEVFCNMEFTTRNR